LNNESSSLRWSTATSSIDRTEAYVLPCKFCEREAVVLIRTARRVWLGCPHCYQTWEIDAAQAEMTSDVGMVSDTDTIAGRYGAAT